jgi:ribosomal protein S18 acetylase RimI-like enzyme
MTVYTFATRPESDLPAGYAGQIMALYRAAGWWEEGSDDAGLVAAIIRNSHCFLAVLEGNRIVAMGRAISDGVSDAYIQDVTVRPDHRDRGIGGKIVRRLVRRLTDDGIGWIGLIAENDSLEFYRRLGFSVMSRAVPMVRKR